MQKSILVTCQCTDLGSASNWLKEIFLAARLIRSTSQIWAVTRHQSGISALVLQRSPRGETSGEMSAVFSG